MDRRTTQYGFSNYNKFQCEWSPFLKLNLNIYFMAILRTAAVSFQTQQFIVHKMRSPPPFPPTSWWFAERTPAAWQTQYSRLYWRLSVEGRIVCSTSSSRGPPRFWPWGGGGGSWIFLYLHMPERDLLTFLWFLVCLQDLLTNKMIIVTERWLAELAREERGTC